MRRRQKLITRLSRRNPLRALVMPLATAAFLGYFGYHAFNGAFGIWSRDRLQEQSAQLSSQLTDLKQQRAALETKVSRLRPEGLDADLVDASARTQLNLLRSDEVVLAPAGTR
jgi:cell division protein FtsB